MLCVEVVHFLITTISRIPNLKWKIYHFIVFSFGIPLRTPLLTMIATQVSSALRAATAAVKLSRVAPAALEVDGVGSFPSVSTRQ